jgi:argininosuccinate lyase
LAQKRDITREILQTAAQEILGKPLSLTAQEVREALNPEHFVRIRSIWGGPAPEETRRAWAVENRQAGSDEAWFDAWQAKLNGYRERLRSEAAAFGA